MLTDHGKSDFTSVQVTISRHDATRYLITSAGVAPTGSSTQVRALVELAYAGFSELLQNAITSNGDVTPESGDVINEDLSLPQLTGLDNKGTINGDVKTNDTEGGSLEWPSAVFLESYYLDSLEDEAPYTTWTAPTPSTFPAQARHRFLFWAPDSLKGLST